jgi:transposase InsO family protein
MPWKEVSAVSARSEFVILAGNSGVNLSALCRRFNISRTTAYKWLGRFRTQGSQGLMDRARKPHSSPRRTQKALEQKVLAIRWQHPAWGARKIRRILLNDLSRPPAPSTIGAILKRANCINSDEALKHRPLRRFERAMPNELWQMDFKGDFSLHNGQRCFPLTALDDFSRFNLLLHACPQPIGPTVQTALISTFQRYGLPQAMLMDNGAPWGHSGELNLTTLSIWLMRLGIRVLHGRPYHPQTQGKEERFHRTLEVELLSHRDFNDHADCQRAFDPWREVYNCYRPHEALLQEVPASRYQPSSRQYPAQLPPIEYSPGDVIRKVQYDGKLYFNGAIYILSAPLAHHPVALRPTTNDGVYDIFFCQFQIACLDVKNNRVYRPLANLSDSC